MSTSTPVTIISSAFGWPEAVSLIISGLSAIAIVALGYWQWWRARRPLVLDVRIVEGLAEFEGEWLVLLALSFINPSSSGRTVYHCGHIKERTQARIRQLEPMRLREGWVRFDLHDDAPKSQAYRWSEVLQLPLDIPPFQSRSKLWFAGLRPCSSTRDPTGLDKWNVRVAFVARDVGMNDLAHYERVLPIEKGMHLVATVGDGAGA